MEYDVVHFVLAFLYMVLFIVSLGVVIRLIRQNNFSARWQKFFHPLLLSGCFARVVFFLLQPFIMEGVMKVDNRLNFFMNTLSSFFFFSDYLIILFLWAEIYHNAHAINHVQIEKLRPIFLALTFAMYCVVAVLYAVDFIHMKPDYSTVSNNANYIEVAVSLFCTAIYLLTSIGFLVYGLRIYYKFQSVPAATKSRNQVLRRIQIITLLVTSCFIVRIGIIIWGATTNLSAHWWFDGLYFTFLELVPLFLMLYTLHGDSRRSKTPQGETSPLLN